MTASPGTRATPWPAAIAWSLAAPAPPPSHTMSACVLRQRASWTVMGASVWRLWWRRRGYLLYSRRGRLLRRVRFPDLIGLPGGRLLERYVRLYWRIRLPLWLVLPAAGWLALGWPGIVPGMATALAAQMALSYRLVSYRRPGRGGPGDPAGVREPRRPYPTGGAGAAELPVDPAPPGMA